MFKRFINLAFNLALILIGIVSQANSRDLSSFRLQLSDEEIALRKRQVLETTRLHHVDSEGIKEVTYEEWLATRGPLLPFSAKLVQTSTPLRADSKICVLVNSDLYPSIESSISQYVADLTSEGYTVEVHTLIGGTPEDLRAFLQSLYSLGMDGCLLIGDLPIAWYEENYDGQELFPCDLYYMDLDGIFYDNDSDGAFDAHDGNKNPEIYVGRLTASPLTYGGADEVTLLTNYFRKNHDYRSGVLFTNNRALAFIDDDWTWDGDYIRDGLAYTYCQSILFNEPSETVADLYKAEITEGYEFVHLAAHSNSGGNWFGSTSIMNYELQEMDPPCLFYTLFACSNCRFVNPNYMGGWYIFNQSYGLAATGTTKTGSMLNFDQFYYPIGQGATIGEAYFLWWDDMANWGLGDYEVSWYYGNVLLGDPTLKSSDRRPVELQEAELPYCLIDRNYSYELDADGGYAPPYGWNIISGALPEGLTLGEFDGKVNGRPTESGIFNFTVTAEDLCQPSPPNYDPILADTLAYSIGIVGRCGDANNSGLVDMDDVSDIIDYLYSGGGNMCPVAGGDMDMFNGTNINDAYYLYEYVAHSSVFPRCPPFTTVIPSEPENILEIRNFTVKPGRDKQRVEFYINSLLPAKCISIPFEYSCATSPVICDSITFGGSAYSHYAHKYGSIVTAESKAVIGIVNTGESPPTKNPAKIASAWFSIEPSSEEQSIMITSTTCGPNDCIIASPSPTTPYIPSLSLIPGLIFECGDANDDGDINILDVVLLINYKYKNGPEPIIPESSNVNGDANIDILDIVYLINSLYKNGPDPSCNQ